MARWAPVMLRIIELPGESSEVNIMPVKESL